MGFKEFISNGWNKVQEGVGQAGKWLGEHQNVLTGLGKGAEMLGAVGVPFAGAVGKVLNTAAGIGQNYNEDKAAKEASEMKKVETDTYKTYMDKMKNQLEQPVNQQTLTSYGNILPLKHSAIDKINYRYDLQSDASSSNSDINFEILSELRALGQEMRMKREKKEQKKMIREVMNKELYKRNQYTQPLALQQESAKLSQYIQQPNELESDDEEPEPEPVPHDQQLSRRRNNIFSDIY